MKRCCATFISIVFVVLVAPAARAVEIVAAASGDWSSTTTWVGGVLPGLEDDVKIPTGLTVTLNTNVECGGIVVEGKLTVERANRTLLCDYLVVQTAGAVFEVGTAASRFLQTFTLTLKGLSTEPAPVMGAKVLGAHNGGKLELHGRDRVEWTRLGVNAPQWSDLLPLLAHFWQRIAGHVAPRHRSGRLKQWLNLLRRRHPEAQAAFDAVRAINDPVQLQAVLFGAAVCAAVVPAVGSALRPC